MYNLSEEGINGEIKEQKRHIREKTNSKDANPI
jgi:hypothetical protein